MDDSPALGATVAYVLVFVEDDSFAELLVDALGDAGHVAVIAGSDEAIPRLLDRHPFQAAIVDLDTRDPSALHLVSRLRTQAPWLKVIVLLPCGGLAPSVDQVPYHLAIAKPARLQALLSALAAVGPARSCN